MDKYSMLDGRGQDVEAYLAEDVEDKIAELEADYKELAEAKPDWDKISYKERLQRANEHYRKYRKQQKEEYKAEITELEANLHETIQLLHGSQADAIREMLVNMKDLHYDPAMLVIQDVKDYADNLEKGDVKL